MTGERDTRRQQLSREEFLALFQRLKRTAVWGPEDRRGALNHITREHIVTAAGEVRVGRTVSLARAVQVESAADNPEPWRHDMTGAVADHHVDRGLDFAMDRLAMNVHGNADSHIDALCHVVFDSKLYNDVPVDVITPHGATTLSIDVARNGIVSRGVLLDIPRLRGRAWLEPGDHVTFDDLVAAERSQDLAVGQGDILFVRVGHSLRRRELGAWNAAEHRSGLHPRALEFLAERGVGVLGSDGNNDTAPSTTEGVDFPVHVLAMNAMGIHLLDWLQFEELTALCEEFGRWTFLVVIAPLRLPTATGSPVNPIAIF